MNYDEFLSERAKHSRASPLRRYARMCWEETPEPLINMAPGFTHDDVSFIVGASFKLRDGTTLELDEEDMKIAQQYSTSDGIKALRDWLTDLTGHVHNPPCLGDENQDKAMQLIINAGGLNGIFAAAETILNPGDKILVPDFFYPTFAGNLLRKGNEPLSITTIEDGPNIEEMEAVLSQFDPTDKESWSRRPKLYYTIPTGGNPTGYTTSLEKRRKIYALAQKYDFIILEDDAYYFQQFTKDPLPTFLSMDVDGRVVRCDTFSKIAGPGLRLGWVCGPHALVQKMMLEIQYSSQHACVVPQVILNKLFRQWGREKFLSNCGMLRDFYKNRCDLVVKAAEKHLTGLATWSVPQAGMFLWLKLTVLEDGEKLITTYYKKYGIIMIPGGEFTMEDVKTCPYIRIAFSVCSEPDLEEGIKRLACAIREAKEKEDAS